jgi:poly-gamma-glutamate synthesis protein (capsule biosynthesis protein)
VDNLRIQKLLFILFFAVCASVINPQEVAVSPVLSAPQTPDTLIAVGDLYFGNHRGTTIINYPEYPWKNIKDILSTGTVRVGNLEAPLSERGAKYTEKKYFLRNNPKTINALSSAGFNIVTLANNHIMDYGPVALSDTINALESVNILYTGAGLNLNEARKPAIITTFNGVKFAFLSYSTTYPSIFWADSNRPGVAHGDPSNFIDDIKNAKAVADHVVVSFHWGVELDHYPLPYHIEYAHQCIESGASIVLGHHPHVLQGLEVYKGGLIAYSLGNFVFGTYSPSCIDSMILAIDCDRSGLIQARVYPVNVNNHEVEFQPTQRKGGDAKRVIQNLQNYSSKFGTMIEYRDGIGIINILN